MSENDSQSETGGGGLDPTAGQSAALAAEAEALAADPEDRREVAAVQKLLDQLSEPAESTH